MDAVQTQACQRPSSAPSSRWSPGSCRCSHPNSSAKTGSRSKAFCEQPPTTEWWWPEMVQLKWIALGVWLATMLMLMLVWGARKSDDRGNVGVADCSVWAGLIWKAMQNDRVGAWKMPDLEFIQLEAVFAGDFRFARTVPYVLRIFCGRYSIDTFMQAYVILAQSIHSFLVLSLPKWNSESRNKVWVCWNCTNSVCHDVRKA